MRTIDEMTDAEFFAYVHSLSPAELHRVLLSKWQELIRLYGSLPEHERPDGYDRSEALCRAMVAAAARAMGDRLPQ
jgi:hypothetical protein